MKSTRIWTAVICPGAGLECAGPKATRNAVPIQLSWTISISDHWETSRWTFKTALMCISSGKLLGLLHRQDSFTSIHLPSSPTKDLLTISIVLDISIANWPSSPSTTLRVNFQTSESSTYISRPHNSLTSCRTSPLSPNSSRPTKVCPANIS